MRRYELRVQYRGMSNHPVFNSLIKRILRIILLLSAGFVAYVWCGMSLRVLICFDRGGLEPGEPEIALPVDPAGTFLRCLGPTGWVAGAGCFALALVMVWAIGGRRWPLRVLVATAPLAIVISLILLFADLNPPVRMLCLSIAAAELMPAVIAAAVYPRLTLPWAQFVSEQHARVDASHPAGPAAIRS